LAVEQDKILFRNCRGDTLSGVLHRPEVNSAGASAILCHGMESNKNSDKLVLMSDALAARGILTLRFDFAYAGESSGKFEDITCSGEVDDLQAAYALIQNRQPGKTAIFGSSLGGTVALLFAAREATVAALVTLAAPLHPENFPGRILTLAQCQQWREQRFTIYHGQRLNVSLLEDLEIIQVSDAVRRIKCPVLIVHPERDANVPIEEARLLASLIPHCRFVQLDTENHMPLADEPAWEKLVAEVRSFLAQPECSVVTEQKFLPLGTLTPRERAVLEGIAEGLGNAEIAGSLRLAEKTVRNHVTRIFDKICVEHRYQAIVVAREAGLGRASRFVNKR